MLLICAVAIFHLLCSFVLRYHSKKLLKILNGLESTRKMTIEEMVAMFLMVIGHGAGNQMIQERFQHSRETISRHFHQVLMACLKLAMVIIKPKDPSFF